MRTMRADTVSSTTCTSDVPQASFMGKLLKVRARNTGKLLKVGDYADGSKTLKVSGPSETLPRDYGARRD